MQVTITPKDRTALLISVEDAKKHAVIDTNDDDQLVEAYIRAATQLASIRTGRCLMPCSVKVEMDGWRTETLISVSPFAGNAALKYFDPSGATQTLDPTLWTASQVHESVLLELDLFEAPELKSGRGVVVLEFDAGFDDMSVSGSENAPDEMDYQIVRLLVSHMYENRGTALVGTLVQQLPFSVQALVDMRRVYR